MRSHFQCIECGATYPLDQTRYTCECGELLDVITDFDAFHRTPEAWRAEWDAGTAQTAFRRYKDFLLPDLPDECVVSLREGDTPLYEADERLLRYCGVGRLLLKHEGMNPTLSFKDRGMVAGVSWAKHLGVATVVCASTGDTSASLAAYAAHAGMAAAVLLPRGKVSDEQLTQAIAYGARVLELETDFDGCMRVVQELARQHEVYLLNSMNSIRIEGQKAIGLETLHQLGWAVPDWFVVPVGNAGNISALGKGLRELHQLGIIGKVPRLIGVESERANPLYVSYTKNFGALQPVVAGQTVASAMQIGNPVSFKKAVRELQFSSGLMEQVSDDEILDAKAAADACGIAICPNSATTLAALRKLTGRGVVGAGDTVVAMMTAHGAKFSASARTYHFEMKARFSNKPTVVEPKLDAVSRALRL
jgi:threonine synthase